MTVAKGNRIAAPLAMIYHTNEDIFFRAIDGLTADELWFCPTDKNTPMLWLAGHIAQTRAVVLQLMGEQIDTQWGELFARASALKEMSEYPSSSEIARTMAEVGAK